MKHFSILLVKNQVSVTADIVIAAENHLHNFTNTCCHLNLLELLHCLYATHDLSDLLSDSGLTGSVVHPR